MFFVWLGHVFYFFIFYVGDIVSTHLSCFLHLYDLIHQFLSCLNFWCYDFWCYFCLTTV